MNRFLQNRPAIEAACDRLSALLGVDAPSAMMADIAADEIERLRAALREIHRCTSLLIHQNTGRWSTAVEHDRRTMGVLNANQIIAIEALGASEP
jgi:hypothetical protein